MSQRQQSEDPGPDPTALETFMSIQEVKDQLTQLRWQTAKLGLHEVGQLLAVAQLALEDDMLRQV
jgi:hypothetical protein